MFRGVHMVNDALKMKRLDERMTQGELAQVLDITVQSYSQKENGRRKFSIPEAQKLAALFGTTVEALFPAPRGGACL
jgi:DNA-binding XRE family transcriptional regulator